jgi:hypothetical protein
MRNRLIKLLRELETERHTKNEYLEYLEDFNVDYSIEEFLDFPNYGLIVNRYDKKYPIYSNDGNDLISSDNAVKAELKRMEADGLVMIGIQKSLRYAYAPNNKAPDHDGFKAKTESVILTTKGKSEWRYFWHKATDNPVTTILSVSAIIISIIALFL